MTINWGSLILVAVATVTAAISIVSLFSLGVAALTSQQRTGGKALAPGPASLTATVSGYACLAVSAAIAAYGLYLIIPQFH